MVMWCMKIGPGCGNDASILSRLERLMFSLGYRGYLRMRHGMLLMLVLLYLPLLLLQYLLVILLVLLLQEVGHRLMRRQDMRKGHCALSMELLWLLLNVLRVLQRTIRERMECTLLLLTFCHHGFSCNFA